MADVSAILLIPAAEYRDALLGNPEHRMDVDAWGDARPPVMWRCDPDDPGPSWRRGPCPDVSWHRERPTSLPVGEHGDGYVRRREWALVLAYSGQVVREGRDRLGYVFACQRWPGVVRPIIGYGTTWAAQDVALFNHAKKKPSQWILMSDEADAVEDFMLTPREDLADDLLCAWSLAAVCAARGLGTVILLDSDGRELVGG